MKGKSMFSPRKAHWDVSFAGQSAAVATYQGRGGVVKGVTLLSQRASNVESVAIGSQLELKIVQHDHARGVTECALWFSSRGTAMGMTADAGFFRS
jgi:hypothetical protein